MLDSLLLSAFVPEYEIYPAIERRRHIVRLQRLPKPKYNLFRTWRPLRTLHIINLSLILFNPKINLIPIPQKLRKAIELRDKFLQIRSIFKRRIILLLDTWEESIGMVEPFALVLPVQGGEWLESDEEVGYYCGVGVETTV